MLAVKLARYAGASFLHAADKGNGPMFATGQYSQYIARRSVICGVREEFCGLRFQEELLPGEPVIQKPDGIMPGSSARERGRQRGSGMWIVFMRLQGMCMAGGTSAGTKGLNNQRSQ